MGGGWAALEGEHSPMKRGPAKNRSARKRPPGLLIARSAINRFKFGLISQLNLNWFAFPGKLVHVVVIGGRWREERRFCLTSDRLNCPFSFKSLVSSSPPTVSDRSRLNVTLRPPKRVGRIPRAPFWAEADVIGYSSFRMRSNWTDKRQRCAHKLRFTL